MARKGVKNLAFPSGGLDKRLAYRQQRPYTTPSACNVRPTGTLEGRERGGSRPGLGKAFDEQLGSGNPIRMLSEVTVVKDDNFTFWTDYFNGEALSDIWSPASWVTNKQTPGILPEDTSSIEYNNVCGVVRDSLSIDASRVYTIEMLIVPWQGEHHGTYSIFARMDNSAPDASDEGIIAELTMTGDDGSYDGSLKVYVGGVETEYTFTAGTTGQAETDWFKVLIDDDTITCFWAGNTLVSQAISTPVDYEIGFGMNCTEAGGICLTDIFRVQYYDNSTRTAEKTRHLLVASSNGELWRETSHGKVVKLTTNLDLASDRMIQATEWGQKLYIADNGPIVAKETDGIIAGNDEDLSSGEIGSGWAGLSLDLYNYVVVLTNGTGNTTDGTYEITDIQASLITLSPEPGDGTCTFRVERGPKVYDPAAATLSLWIASSGEGQVPTGCKLICTYRDRLVLGATTDAPHVWYMARQGNPLDWDYGDAEDDMGRAVAGTNSEAGRIAEPLTAMIPFFDDYLVFGAENSSWILRGDTVYGGQLDALSRTIGIVDKFAQCPGPSGELLFLSRDGLYGLPKNPDTAPQSIYRERLPKEMLDVDTDLYSVSMAYDVRDRGVHIYLTPVDADPSGTSERLHYWFDWETKGFWPERYQGAHEPFVVRAYMSSVAEDSAVLLGCRDGYIRRYRDTFETDDGELMQSHVLIGPFSLNTADDTEGVLTDLVGVLDDDSGPVAWSVQVGDSYEDVVNAGAFTGGKWVGGANYRVRPRARGMACGVKLEPYGLIVDEFRDKSGLALPHVGISTYDIPDLAMIANGYLVITGTPDNLNAYGYVGQADGAVLSYGEPWTVKMVVTECDTQYDLAGVGISQGAFADNENWGISGNVSMSFSYGAVSNLRITATDQNSTTSDHLAQTPSRATPLWLKITQTFPSGVLTFTHSYRWGNSGVYTQLRQNAPTVTPYWTADLDVGPIARGAASSLFSVEFSKLIVDFHSGSRRWAMDRITGRARTAGRQRLP